MSKEQELYDQVNRLKWHSHSQDEISNQTGWIPSSLTWTYASASTYTIPGDVTATYQKGTYLKWLQTTQKYAVIASSSYSAPKTTVTIIVNTDYTIANAEITSPYYSFAANPQGWPGWFNYSPTLTGWSVVPPTYVYRYYPIGRKITLLIAQQANGTSNTTGVSGTLPVQAATVSGSNLTWLSTGLGVDNGVTLTTPIRADIVSGASQWGCYTNMASGAWTNTGNKRVYFQIEYEF